MCSRLPVMPLGFCPHKILGITLHACPTPINPQVRDGAQLYTLKILAWSMPSKALWSHLPRACQGNGRGCQNTRHKIFQTSFRRTDGPSQSCIFLSSCRMQHKTRQYKVHCSAWSNPLEWCHIALQRESGTHLEVLHSFLRLRPGHV